MNMGSAQQPLTPPSYLPSEKTSSDALPAVKDPLPVPENCGNPTPISCGTPISSTTIGMGNDVKYNGNVAGVTGVSFSGPDRLFVLTLAQKSNLQIVLDIALTTVDLDILLMNTCNPANVVAASVKNNKTTGVKREILDVNCDAGTWYIMIDGKAATDQGVFTLQADCTCDCQETLAAQPGGDKLFADDFENYSVGKLSVQGSRWSLWSSNTPDATVAGESILSSNKVAMFAGSSTSKPDLIYRTDNATAGRFRLSWRMKVTTGKKGYFDILHTLPANGGVIAYETEFFSTGKGEVRINNGQAVKIVAARFDYQPGAWVNVTNIIDINNDVAELWIADVFVGSWKFTTSHPASANTTQRKTLAGPSFWANGSDYSFAVDNICIWQKKASCLATSVVLPVYTERGNRYNNMGLAACDLYTPSEMGTSSSVCDMGGAFIDRAETYSGVLEPFDDAPAELKLPGGICNASAGTAAIFAEVYTFYNLKKKSNGQPEQISLNYNSSTGVRCHIFACQNLSTGLYTGQPVCVGEVKSGQAFTVPANYHPDVFYYIVFWGPLGSSYNNFSIIPEGFCQSGATTLSIANGNIAGSIGAGAGDPRFSRTGEAYKSCYSGSRTYAGREAVYKFTVSGTGSMQVRLISKNHPVGAFAYSSICGGSCVAFGENVQKDTASFGFPVTPGVYYIVVDRNATNGTGNFVLQTNFIGSIPNGPTCNALASAAKTHRLLVSPAAYIFKKDDAVSVMYDAPDNKLRQTEVHIINSTILPFEIRLSDSCDYKPNEQFKIYMSRQNGTQRSFYPMNLSFVPVGINGNTGGERFERTKLSTLEYMSPAATIPFGSDTRLLSFISTATAAQLQQFRLSTGNTAWKSLVTDSPISETPVNTPWLTYTPPAGTGTAVISVSVTPHTGTAGRSAYIRFYAESQPHLLAHVVRVDQFGINGGKSGDEVEDRGSTGAEGAVVRTLPNPTTGQGIHYLSLPHPATVAVQLWDMTGRLIQTLQPPADLEGEQMWDIDLSAQPNGLYHIVTTVNGSPLRQTLVVQR